MGLSELIRQQDSKPTCSKSSAALINRSPKPSPRCRIKSKSGGKISVYSFSLPSGVKTPTPRAIVSCSSGRRPPQTLQVAREIASAISRKKQIFKSAASSGVSGGCNRVFTAPARGAFVMIASAQRPAEIWLPCCRSRTRCIRACSALIERSRQPFSQSAYW